MVKELYLSKLRELRKKLRADTTKSERYLWNFIRRKQLGYKFLRQVSIGYFVVDFYCKELALAIELDGGIHNIPSVKERDAIRQEIIESKGVVFLRFTNDEVFYKTELVLLKIEALCFKIGKNIINKDAPPQGELSRSD